MEHGEISPLSDETIDLWMVFQDEVGDPTLLDRYRQILTAEERRREQQFQRSNDRLRYVVARALVRTTLSRYVPMAPADWRFEVNEYGRPTVAEADGPGASISFNVSHTDGLIVLGVTRSSALGVDVENVLRRQAPLEAADRFFSPREAQALHRVVCRQRSARFFDYWTLKESFIKAKGKGLSIPLERFSFDLETDGSIHVDCEPALGESSAGWWFWLIRPTPEFTLALCAERRSDNAPLIAVHQAVPLIRATPLTLAPCRSSAGIT